MYTRSLEKKLLLILLTLLGIGGAGFVGFFGWGVAEAAQAGDWRVMAVYVFAGFTCILVVLPVVLLVCGVGFLLSWERETERNYDD